MKFCLMVGADQMVVCAEDGAISLPDESVIRPLLAADAAVVTVHAACGDVLAASVDNWVSVGSIEARPFRPLFSELQEADFSAACKARQMLHWERHSRYCPSCGTRTEPMLDNARRCPSCGNEIFPPIAPAIIVRVERGDDEILMVRAHNFRSDFYGLVAGFVEPGETLEECVAREVKEETGLDITDIRYACSQPWPFPSGLMIGFVAKYAGGEIVVQQEELKDARFFRRSAMPNLPSPMSIARRLVDEWLRKE